MFRFPFFFIFLFALVQPILPQVLYSSLEFKLTADSVIQGNTVAFAPSRTKIFSNFPSGSWRLKSTLICKFAINGIDNETPHGKDHRIILNPVRGKFSTPLLRFGDTFTQQDFPNDAGSPFVETSDPFDVLFRLDMRHVFASFDSLGYFECFNGLRIAKKDFSFVSISGGTQPLSWDFEAENTPSMYRLSDSDGDHIYEVTLPFNKDVERRIGPNGFYSWELSRDIISYPSYTSNHTLIDALYNLSLEELSLDLREDGALMAGALWTGVWTRDISYSIFLSLAAIDPDACKVSLLAKVKDNMIIQDTGTGGSWPISSDRMIWAIAAWEVYLVTGDEEWLRTIYPIIKNSAEADQKTLVDPVSGLMRGESSFQDWREQSYPKWMDPKDIFSSQNLATTIIHAETYRILGDIAVILNEPSDSFYKESKRISEAVQSYFFLADKGFFAQYRLGRIYQSLFPRVEHLGNALAVLFSVASDNQKQRIISETPVTPLGIPCFYPQIPNIPSYHNNGIWPFVHALWTWSAADAGNERAVEYALASFYRAPALYLTNKENYSIDGNPDATEINSNRQLWSVAGNLSLIYRTFFGMRFSVDGLSFRPFVPYSFRGEKRLENFRYREALLSITLKGWGSEVSSITLDGEPLDLAVIPASLFGSHSVVITMNESAANSDCTITENGYAPETPVITVAADSILWKPIDGAQFYKILINGILSGVQTNTGFLFSKDIPFAEVQVIAVDKYGFESFPSEPLRIEIDSVVFVSNSNPLAVLERKYKGFTAPGYTVLENAQTECPRFIFTAEKEGWYALDFRYANGSGPINTDNKACIRTLVHNGSECDVFVFPQRGIDAWEVWGYSSSLRRYLHQGEHVFELPYMNENKNMNGEINRALLDVMRITFLGKH